MSTVRIPKGRLTRKFFEHTFFPFRFKPSEKQKTPGMHGKEHPRDSKPHNIARFFKQLKLSPYALRLRHKQILRFHYNVRERQLQRYVLKAKKSLGRNGETLIALLEMRLDTLVYRSCFATSIRQARQFVRHGHICVNGNKVDVPSYGCHVYDMISVASSSPLKKMISKRLHWTGKKYRKGPKSVRRKSHALSLQGYEKSSGLHLHTPNVNARTMKPKVEEAKKHARHLHLDPSPAELQKGGLDLESQSLRGGGRSRGRGGGRGGGRGRGHRQNQAKFEKGGKKKKFLHYAPNHLRMNRKDVTSKVIHWIKHEDTWVERQYSDNPAKVQLRFIIEYYNR